MESLDGNGAAYLERYGMDKVDVIMIISDVKKSGKGSDRLEVLDINFENIEMLIRVQENKPLAYDEPNTTRPYILVIIDKLDQDYDVKIEVEE